MKLKPHEYFDELDGMTIGPPCENTRCPYLQVDEEMWEWECNPPGDKCPYEGRKEQTDE